MAVNRYDGSRAWYAISTYSGYEDKVADSIKQRIGSVDLADKIFDAIVPKEKQIEIKNGKRRVADKKIFQGYVLVEMCLSDETWYIIRNTPGVTGFVGTGTQPTPVSTRKWKRSRNAWALKIQNSPSITKLAKSYLLLMVHSRASRVRFPRLMPTRVNSKFSFPCLVARLQLSSMRFKSRKLTTNYSEQTKSHGLRRGFLIFWRWKYLLCLSILPK